MYHYHVKQSNHTANAMNINKLTLEESFIQMHNNIDAYIHVIIIE